MADDPTTEELRVQRSKLRALIHNAQQRPTVRESQVDTYHETLVACTEAGFDMTRWYVPENLLKEKPSHVTYVGGGSQSSARTMFRPNFELYAVPAYETLNRELVNPVCRFIR